MGNIVKKITRLFILLFMLVAVRPAAAHSDLVQAEPPPGAQLAESPAEIRLTFSEPVADNSRIDLLTDEFERIEGLVPQFNPEQPEQIYSPVPPLEPGVYTVQWAAVSDDGHEISGSYSFSVGAGQDTSEAGTAAEPEAATEPANDQNDTSRSSWWLGALVLVAIGLPLILILVRKGSAR